MVAYSFKSGFVPLLEAGSKQQTIRLPRKRHAAAGEGLQLYYGMRTRQCRLIGTATCLAVQSVMLRLSDNVVEVGEVAEILAADDLAAFAIRDGFMVAADARRNRPVPRRADRLRRDIPGAGDERRSSRGRQQRG